MSLRSFFERRVRGVRVIELWAGGLTLVLALGVYLAKTGAGDEGADGDPGAACGDAGSGVDGVRSHGVSCSIGVSECRDRRRSGG